MIHYWGGGLSYTEGTLCCQHRKSLWNNKPFIHFKKSYQCFPLSSTCSSAFLSLASCIPCCPSFPVFCGSCILQPTVPLQSIRSLSPSLSLFYLILYFYILPRFTSPPPLLKGSLSSLHICPLFKQMTFRSGSQNCNGVEVMRKKKREGGDRKRGGKRERGGRGRKRGGEREKEREREMVNKWINAKLNENQYPLPLPT